VKIKEDSVYYNRDKSSSWVSV